MTKPILCLDFDGVVHSYTSGWQGIDVIPDPIVPGAHNFLCKALEVFDVHIYSSRSSSESGIQAMKDYMRYNFLSEISQAVKFPSTKPPAFITIDDRAITFKGEWPNVEELLRFKPWNKE